MDAVTVPDLSHVVPQRTRADCFVAALATVQGWSYEKTREALGAFTYEAGTSLMPVARALLPYDIAGTWLLSKAHPQITAEMAHLHNIRMCPTPDEMRRLLPGRKAVVCVAGQGPNGETGPQYGHALAWDGEIAIECGSTADPREPTAYDLAGLQRPILEVLLLTDMAPRPKTLAVAPTIELGAADHEALAEIMDRHERVFLGFSGGKESVALAHMLAPWRERIRLVWVHTGYMAPHMYEFIKGHGERFAGLDILRSPDLQDHWQAHGTPAEVFPLDRLQGYGGQRLQPWTHCCHALRQAPLNAFLRDQVGPCCLIHGQRRDDKGGATIDGLRTNLPPTVEIAMPLAAWSEADVYAYVAQHRLELPQQYAQGYPDSIECLVCPAPMKPERWRYLKRYHPDKVPLVQTVAMMSLNETREAANRLAATIEVDPPPHPLTPW